MKKVVFALPVIAACAAAFWIASCGFNGDVYVDGKAVSDVKDTSDIAEAYLKENEKDLRVFADKDLEDKYIEKYCSVHTDKPLFILRLLHEDLRPDVICQAKGGGTVETAIKQACDDYNAANAKEAADTSVSFNKDKRRYSLKKSVTGSYADSDATIKEYQDKKHGISLVIKTQEPEVTTKLLKKAVKTANEALSWHVYYDKDYTIQYPADAVAISGSAVVVKKYNFSNELVHLDTLYGTAGQKHTVKLHNGKKYTTDKGTWGELTDSTREREFLMKAFNERKSYELRKPVMKKRDPALIIEVDKSKQHVWAYTPESKAVMDSGCVTGRKGVHDTPTGIFFISQLSKDYDMHGDDYVSHCQRFMRITNSGVALHDASWRYRFGGNIYTYNGSHGCINLPTAFALRLADKVVVGNTMVIVH